MLDRKSLRLLFALLVALSVVLAGCGGGATPAPEDSAPSVDSAPLAGEEVLLAEEAVVEEAVAEEAVEAVSEFDLVAVVDAYMSAIPEGYMSVSLDSFKEIMDTGEVVVIDVREAGEYEKGHVPGAINIPIRTLAQNLDKVPADKPVVVYCQSGFRAGMANSALHILGYENARAFAASYKGWTEAGEAVETEPVAAVPYEVPEIEPELLAAVDDFLSGIPEGFLAMGDIEKFNEAIDNGAFLVDVREEKEYQAGHIPGAINIPIRTLAQKLDQIPADKPVFVYCKSGYRAALSTAALQMLGFTNVKAFSPGFDGWSAAGEPVAAAQ
jgi:rhodanese-related sulfurtransferase